MQKTITNQVKGTWMLFGTISLLVMLLSTITIAKPLSITQLDSALQKEYPEVYPPGSDPGFTRSKVFLKLNGDDPDQISVTLDSTRTDIIFSPSILEGLEGLVAPWVFEELLALKKENGITVRAMASIGLPAIMGPHALMTIPVPDSLKHPNQRLPRKKEFVPDVINKDPVVAPVIPTPAPVPAPAPTPASAQQANAKPAPAPVTTPTPAPTAAPAPTTPAQAPSTSITSAVAAPIAYQLSFDGKPLGETVVKWNADSSDFEFRSPTLAEAFDAKAPASEKGGVAAKDGWFNAASLKKANLQVQADKSTGAITIGSPDSWNAPITEDPPIIAPMDTTPVDYSKISKDELYARIFKKAPPPRMRDFMVRLFIDGKEMEQAKVIWDERFTKYTFFSRQLAHYLDTSLTPENRIKVNGIDGNFHSERLIGTGFKVELDEAEYFLKLQTPPELKSMQVHEMGVKMEDYFEGPKIAPAILSAYLNTHLYQNFNYSERIFTDDSTRDRYEQYNGASKPIRSPFSAELDGAIRFHDWVLQSTGNINEPEQGNWDRHALKRQQTQLIHDYVPINSRLTLLDISPSLPHANLSSPMVLGARFDYTNALYDQPNSEYNKVSFQLANSANVEVYVNGVLQKTLQLSSGTHVIQGFNGRPGLNNIELQVTYEDGFRQSIPFEFIESAPVNLKKGDNKGHFATGFKRIETSWNPEYSLRKNEDRVLTTIFHHGFTYNITGSAFGGVSQNLQVLGARLVWSPDTTKYWEVVQTFSLSDRQPLGREFSIRLNKQLGRISAGTYFTRTEREFRNQFFSEYDADQKVKFLVGINISSPIWRGTANAFANANFNHKDTLYSAVDYTLGTGYSLRALRNLNFDAAASLAVIDHMSKPSLSLTASYFFNAQNHSGYVLNQTQRRKAYIPPEMIIHKSVDTTMSGNSMLNDSVEFVPGSYKNKWMNITNAGWSWSEGMGLVNGNSYSANVGFETVNDYNARIAYQHTSNFGMLSSSYSVTDQRGSHIMARSHNLSTRVSTSFMFADGLWGIGRPVSEGFVLVNGQHELSDTEIRMNPSEQYSSEYSHSFGWMSATYGELSAYRTDAIKLKLENPPAGVFMENGNYTIQNSYKQGYALRIGMPPSVFIRVRIIDESKQPVAYTTFQIFEKQSTNKMPLVQSFTNKNGVLQAPKLKPGYTYRIVFGDDAFIKVLEITIPKNASGIYDFGDISVAHETLASKLAALQKKE